MSFGLTNGNGHGALQDLLYDWRHISDSGRMHYVISILGRLAPIACFYYVKNLSMILIRPLIFGRSFPAFHRNYLSIRFLLFRYRWLSHWWHFMKLTHAIPPERKSQLDKCEGQFFIRLKSIGTATHLKKSWMKIILCKI